MAKGGYRVGSGRPKGVVETKPRRNKVVRQTDNENIKRMLALGLEAKTTLYQEFIDRVKKGETLSIVEKRMMEGISKALVDELDANRMKAEPENLGADEFLKSVWNNPMVDISLRIRAAEVVFRSTTDTKGKKEIKDDKAKSVGQGKFSSGRAPLTMVK
jgi:hypothetical protein